MPQSNPMEEKIRLSMAAWNAMTEAERAAALSAAQTAVPAHAMRHLGWDIPESIPPALNDARLNKG